MTLRPRQGSKGTARTRAWDDQDRRNMLLNVSFGVAIVASLLLLVVAFGVSWYGDHLSAAVTVNGQSVSKDGLASAAAVNQFRWDYQRTRIRTLTAAGHLRASDGESRTALLDQKVQNIDALTQEQLVDGMIQADLASKQSVVVSDADVDAKIKEEATTPELRHVLVIAVKPTLATGETVATDAEKAAAKTAADNALADVKGGKDWATVAKAVSTDTSKDQGGDIGYLDKDSSMDGTLMAAVQAQPKDGITDVIAAEDGTCWIAKVTDILAASEDTGFLQKVKDAGLNMDDYRAAVRRDVTRSRLSEAILAPYLTAGLQRQVSDIFLESSTSESGPKAVKTRHILYSPNGDPNNASSVAATDPAWAAAKAKADDAYARVQKDPSLFDSIARAESDEGAAKTSGGKLPYFSTDDSIDQAFADAIFADGLKAGQILAPVKSAFGWHVIQIMHYPTDDAFAKQLKSDLDAGKVTFADAARDNSDDSASGKGGDLGWVAKGQLNAELEKAIFAAPVGKISDPVTVASKGIYIFNVVKEESRPLDPNQKKTITSTVFADWYSTQKATYKVTRASDSSGTAG